MTLINYSKGKNESRFKTNHTFWKLPQGIRQKLEFKGNPTTLNSKISIIKQSPLPCYCRNSSTKLSRIATTLPCKISTTISLVNWDFILVFWRRIFSLGMTILARDFILFLENTRFSFNFLPISLCVGILLFTVDRTQIIFWSLSHAFTELKKIMLYLSGMLVLQFDDWPPELPIACWGRKHLLMSCFLSPWQPVTFPSRTIRLCIFIGLQIGWRKFHMLVMDNVVFQI